MKPALNQETSPVIPLNKFSFIGKIFFGLKTGGRVYQILLAVTGTLVIAGGVFFSLKWYESRQRKVFAASAYQVELPKGIDKEDLQNPTNEQRTELNNQIVKSLQAQARQARLSKGVSQPVVVVLTQNGQPIVPTTGVGGIGGQGPTSVPPTSAPPTGIPPTSPPSSPTPTLIPSPTPTAEYEPNNCQGSSSSGSNTCSDTDGGKNYSQKGTISDHRPDYSLTDSDSCWVYQGHTYLREYCCVPNGTATFWDHTCPNGCQDGVCLGSGLTPSPPPTYGPCTDSDNGFNVYVKGTVTQPGHILSPFTDYCAEVDGISYDRPYLFEYTCENNYWKMNTYNCPNDSCHDGVCTQGQPTPTPTVWCHDTDSGKDYYVYGTVTTSWGTTSDDRCQKMEAGGHYVDCSGEGCLLFERYCPDQHTLWTDVYQCPYACKNGACISPPAGTPTITPTPADRCADSDGGKIFNIKGRTVPAPGYSSDKVGIDSCINSTKLNEYYCHEDGKHLAATEPACPAGCYEGVCLNQNECTDSDGGQNFYVKGFVKPKPGYSQDQIGWDNCFSMDNKQMVQEYYCHPEGNLAQTYTDCPNGCQDGACIEAPIPPTPSPSGQCTDSDGIDYYTRGKVTDKKGKTHEDYCAKDQNASADPNYLAEFSCQRPEADQRVAGVTEDTQDNYFTISYDCPAGCQNGGCLPPVTRGSRAGISVSGEAQDEYKNKYDRDLMADINKIYLTAREKYGFPQLTKKIDFGVLKVTQNIPSFFNATTNEIVFPQGNLPSEEGLAFLVAASLGKDLTGLPLKKLDQEIKKIPSGKITRDVFEPLSKKEAPAPIEKPTNPPADESAQKPVSDCAADWEEYLGQKHGFKLKIPSGWTLEPSIKKPETDSFTEIEIMSTTHPEARVDPSQRISSFFVVASKKDPKTDEEYGYKSLFEHPSEDQIKSQIEFKGMKAEKYVDETPAFGAEHRFELYYFKNGDFYYLLNIGIFTGDLKEKNEKILNCFLDNFELLGQEEADLIPCPENLLSTTEQLNEAQENWWKKPDRCEGRPEQKICGYIRSIYDNGVIQVGNSDYRNPYCYCSFFEKNGSRVYRGTEMFSLGYKEGACVK